ncbi:MAG: ATP-binding cassette domain-containing protein, partial [Acidobacteriota bacterium]|nr:ATP-binding cassette domain-containing protein [Acidobacteriota bacterium]
MAPPPVRRLEPGSTLTVRPGRGGAHAGTFGQAAARAGDPSRARARRTVVPMLERMRIEELSISYGRRQAVRSVSLPVRQGEVLALIGPSGCGKTTLLRSLNRLTELTRSAVLSGRVTLDGVDIAELEPTALRRRVTM